MELSRIMAIDYGEKRIGIALSDLLQMIAQPYLVLANNRDIWENLRQLINEQKVGKAVIGLPLNFAGEDTIKTGEIRQFAAEFTQQLSLPWEFFDESFTSEDANAALEQMGYSIRDSRKVIDKVAAALILQNYLESR
ncbi:MAG: Holliday junction resolvase RuvX [Candidatus Cloacimonetes bacterium]|nr:Holliday junction resolvase RuvX [Candidatus Cloacimonadota bacterium]